MVSDADPNATRTDPSFDERRLYAVIRKAVEDALLDVVGTLLLVGVAFVLVWAGGTAAFSGAGDPVVAGVGLLVALVGFYIAAAALEVIPPVREWL